MTQLEKTLLSKGWNAEQIQEITIDIFHQLMELYYLESVEEVGDKYNLVIEENLGFVCEVKEIFALYDELVERSYPSEVYYGEREKQMQYV